MKRFDVVKTIQLVLLAILTVGALVVVLGDGALYAQLSADPSVRRLAALLWAALGISFVFLFYDFNSYADLKRENIELDNAIYSDALTGIANRYSVDVYIGQFLNKPLPADMGCVTIELTSLSEINAALGHTGGDAALQAFSDILLGAANGACFIGRNGGNKFVAIFRDCSEKRLERFLAGVRKQTDARNARQPDARIEYAVGTAFNEGELAKSVMELVALSDRRAQERH